MLSLQSAMKYYDDYPKKPMGGSNPYYGCAHCGYADPHINGMLENHAAWCPYRKEKEKELREKTTPEQDALDAKRYRWLRDCCDSDRTPQYSWILEAPADMWDKAIDEAMEEVKDDD